MTCITSHSFSGDNPRLFVVKETATIMKFQSKSSFTVFRHALSMPSMNDYMSRSRSNDTQRLQGTMSICNFDHLEVGAGRSGYVCSSCTPALRSFIGVWEIGLGYGGNNGYAGLEGWGRFWGGGEEGGTREIYGCEGEGVDGGVNYAKDDWGKRLSLVCV